ncbi:transporter substrate-binding domain-containing protein [Hyphomicrobiaceae bacterium 22]|uniref:Transporter substrate-binding domain-containing protein n=2 Tax=Prosthecodimorpha staleyi TaxID=2840188 RepID=A0A947D451_9HYPH|nr:transporter substrate-binding domain-containing protein [Prosthecodimorpha staleyi]
MRDTATEGQNRREALGLALGFGTLASLAAAAPAKAQVATDSTFERVRSSKVVRIAVLPGELPYFQKNLSTGEWSGFAIEMAKDIAKTLDAKLEFTESTYGNSVLELQSGKIDIAFALSATPQRALVIDFTRPVFNHPFGAILRKGLDLKTWGEINNPDLRLAVDAGSANETAARRFAPKAQIKTLKTRDEVMLEIASGRADGTVIALILGLTAVAKNPNLGTYRILDKPKLAIASCMGIRRETDQRWHDFLSTWVDYNRGIGQMREWFQSGLQLSGVSPDALPVDLDI